MFPIMLEYCVNDRVISVNTFFFSQPNLLQLKEKYIFSQLSGTKSLIYEYMLKVFMNFFLTSICHFLSHIYFKKYKTNCPNGEHYHLDISHRKNPFSLLSHLCRKLALHCPKLIFSTSIIMFYWWWYTLLKYWFILNMLTGDWSKSLQVFCRWEQTTRNSCPCICEFPRNQATKPASAITRVTADFSSLRRSSCSHSSQLRLSQAPELWGSKPHPKST